MSQRYSWKYAKWMSDDVLVAEAEWDVVESRWRDRLTVEGCRWDDPEPESEGEMQNDRLRDAAD